MEQAPHVLGRECGSCTLCCKLMAIVELEKPIGTWCQHVRKGHGCAIYANRPASCAQFHCGYLIWPAAGEHWRPSRSKMVLVIDDNRMAVHVDPNTPNVWKTDPFYSDLKSWAQHAAAENGQLMVAIGHNMIAILPDGEVDLGYVGEDHLVFTGRREDGSYGARKERIDDPRNQGGGQAGPPDPRF